jgi:uncharacterized membrane protein YfcA
LGGQSLKWGGDKEIWIMNPFDWKNNPLWLLLIMPFIAMLMALGINLGHSLLSVVLSIAVIFVVLYLYISKKSKKPKDEQKE